MPQATSDIPKEADEAGAVDLGELKSPFYEDSVAIAEEPLPAPVSQAPVYSFSLKRKVDSSHMGSSKKQVTSDLVEGVSKTGNAVGCLRFHFCFFFFLPTQIFHDLFYH